MSDENDTLKAQVEATRMLDARDFQGMAPGKPASSITGTLPVKPAKYFNPYDLAEVVFDAFHDGNQIGSFGPHSEPFKEAWKRAGLAAIDFYLKSQAFSAERKRRSERV